MAADSYLDRILDRYVEFLGRGGYKFYLAVGLFSVAVTAYSAFVTSNSPGSSHRAGIEANDCLERRMNLPFDVAIRVKHCNSDARYGQRRVVPDKMQ